MRIQATMVSVSSANPTMLVTHQGHLVTSHQGSVAAFFSSGLSGMGGGSNGLIVPSLGRSIAGRPAVGSNSIHP